MRMMNAVVPKGGGAKEDELRPQGSEEEEPPKNRGTPATESVRSYHSYQDSTNEKQSSRGTNRGNKSGQ